MIHILKFPVFASNRIPGVTADPDTQADGLERLAKLARNASPETRARLERTIAAVAQSRRIRSMTLMTVQQAKEKLASLQQGFLPKDTYGMDEEILSPGD